MKNLLLIGCGAMGRNVLHALRGDDRVHVGYVLDVPERRAALQEQVGSETKVIASLDELVQGPDFALECAVHAAVGTSVIELLERGIDTITASVGALAEAALPLRLERAASAGG